MVSSKLEKLLLLDMGDVRITLEQLLLRRSEATHSALSDLASEET